jgi:phosphatidylserine/phosphatidylglycerophosphate/cardiolipin synthase-like enzyme
MAPEIDDWFLTAAERGNPATSIDRRGRDRRAWTEGNLVQPLVHGSTYYRRLLGALTALDAGDLMLVAEWRGDPDERLDGPGTEVGQVLADLARTGVEVRGLLWRSHFSKAFSERQNLHLGDVVNQAGGEILLDQRVRGPGSHHQKLVVVQRADPDQDVAFAGGIDLAHGRRDDPRHQGEPQTIEMNLRYGPRPPGTTSSWSCTGQRSGTWPSASGSGGRTRPRWTTATRSGRGSPHRLTPLPPERPDPGPAGPHAVQVLRTYPSKHPRFPSAPRGERSIARAYRKALGRARRLVYIEDQYLWSTEIARVLAEALDRAPTLQLVAVLPPYPENPGRLGGVPEGVGRQRALGLLREAGGDRVAVYDLENEAANPIYVHARCA